MPNHEVQGAKITPEEYRNRKKLLSLAEIIPIFRREVVNPEGKQKILEKLSQGIGVLGLGTHPGMKEALEYYVEFFSDPELAHYEIGMGVASHQEGRVINWLASKTGVTFKYITTPETIRKHEKTKKKLGFKDKPKPVLYEGIGELTAFTGDLLKRGGYMGLFPQGTRSPQLESVDDMKSLSRLALIIYGRHGIDFAVAFIGIDMIGIKDTEEYEKNKDKKSLLRKYRYTYDDQVEMISDMLNDPEVQGDYRKLDGLAKKRLGRLVGEVYRNGPNQA